MHGDGVVVAGMAGIRREADTDDRTGHGSKAPPPGNSQGRVLI
jgi:hypothetical protein